MISFYQNQDIVAQAPRHQVSWKNGSKIKCDVFVSKESWLCLKSWDDWGAPKPSSLLPYGSQRLAPSPCVAHCWCCTECHGRRWLRLCWDGLVLYNFHRPLKLLSQPLFSWEGALQLVRRKTEYCKDGRDCASYAAVAHKKSFTNYGWKLWKKGDFKCLVGSQDPLQAILLAFALLNSGYSGIHTNLNRIEKWKFPDAYLRFDNLWKYNFSHIIQFFSGNVPYVILQFYFRVINTEIQEFQ